MTSLKHRLERLYEEEMTVVIPQADGTIARFAKEDLKDAFRIAMDRHLGRTDRDHPLCQAARRSPDPRWREGAFAGPEVVL